MEFYIVLLIALGLAMDCFAVSLGVGTSPIAVNRRLIFRLSFHFGLFQGGMTLLGWLAGSTVVNLIARFDHWVAFILLAWVGIRMIWEGLSHENDKQHPQVDPSRGKTLVILSVATSIDALAVGLSLAMIKVNILLSSLTIALTSLLLSMLGLLVGKKLSQRFGSHMEILGGVILNLIGLRILIEHAF